MLLTVTRTTGPPAVANSDDSDRSLSWKAAAAVGRHVMLPQQGPQRAQVAWPAPPARSGTAPALPQPISADKPDLDQAQDITGPAATSNSASTSRCRATGTAGRRGPGPPAGHSDVAGACSRRESRSSRRRRMRRAQGETGTADVGAPDSEAGP